MKNKILKTFLFFVLVSALLITASFAVEIKEDVADYESDVYIIGSTRFDANQTITATMAANAGLNEAKVQVALNKDISNLKVNIYFYDSIFGDWYEINKDAKAELIEDTTTIKNIEDNLNIFYEEGVEKTLEVKYDGDVDKNSLPNGVTYEDGKFLVPATTFNFTFEDSTGVEIEVNTNVDTNIKEGKVPTIEDVEIIPEWAAMQINGKYYAADELEEAVEAAKAGDTVKLLKSIELENILKIDKDLILDLNTYTLTGTGDEVLMVNGNNCEVTVKNGNIVCKGSASVVVGEKDNYTGEKAVLNIEEDATVTTDKYGVFVVGPNTVANIYGKVIVPEGANANGWAVGGNGNAENAGTKINIFAGALVESKVGLALYLPQEGVTNIDGTVKGHSGIGIKAGTLNVNKEASLIATGASISNEQLAANNSGISTSGDIIFVECHNNYADNVHINVLAELAEDADSNIIRVFKPSNVTKDIKEIKGVYTTAHVQDVNGTLVTTYNKDVAAITVENTNYAEDSVDYALNLFATGKETSAKLLKDITINEILEVQAKKAVLDLGGYVLTGTGDEVLMVNGNNSELTVKNGNIVCKGSASVVVGEKDNYTGEKAVLNIEEDVTVTTDKYGVFVVGPNTVANIYGKVIVPEGANANGWAVGGNGNAENAGTTINIHKGALIESKVGLALFLPQEGVTNIDGTVKGHSAIGIKAGTLNVTETASLIATGVSISNEEIVSKNSGISTSGDIIFVECHDGYADNVNITINADLEADSDSNIIRVFKPANVENEVKKIDGLYKTATSVTLANGATVTTYTK